MKLTRQEKILLKNRIKNPINIGDRVHITTVNKRGYVTSILDNEDPNELRYEIKTANDEIYVARAISVRRHTTAALQKRAKNYGLSYEQYMKLLELQNYACAICKDTPEAKVLNIDHDHSCCNSGSSCGKCVRGLLCSRCNFGLGAFKDSISNLEKAVQYLSQRSL